MIQIEGLTIYGSAKGPNAPWRRMELPTQDHLRARDSKDAVSLLETTYGPRVKGTLKTSRTHLRETGVRHRECTFVREHDGYTVTSLASWFEITREDS